MRSARRKLPTIPERPARGRERIARLATCPRFTCQKCMRMSRTIAFGLRGLGKRTRNSCDVLQVFCDSARFIRAGAETSREAAAQRRAARDARLRAIVGVQ